MSFLKDLLGTGQSAPAGGGALIGVVGQLIERAGGLTGLLATLQQHGLGEAVQSWIGHGANQPVSSGELGQALQHGGLDSVLQEAAGKLGLDQGDLLGKLSQVLPQAVDHLTPDGQAPVPGQGGGFDLGSLAGLAGKLFGKSAG